MNYGPKKKSNLNKFKQIVIILKKKCKLWFPKTFQYVDYIEQFESTFFYLKFLQQQNKPLTTYTYYN